MCLSALNTEHDALSNCVIQPPPDEPFTLPLPLMAFLPLAPAFLTAFFAAFLVATFLLSFHA